MKGLSLLLCHSLCRIVIDSLSVFLSLVVSLLVIIIIRFVAGGTSHRSNPVCFVSYS